MLTDSTCSIDKRSFPSLESLSVPGLRRANQPASSPVLVIHGGAGTMSRDGSTPEQRDQYIHMLKTSLLKGYAILQQGGEAMDAAVAAVGVMEGNLSKCE